MADEKDRFGETMKLVERAKEDIYFEQHDRELIEKLKAQLEKADKQESQLHCPKCPGLLETYTFQGFALDRCQNCGAIWIGSSASATKKSSGSGKRRSEHTCHHHFWLSPW